MKLSEDIKARITGILDSKEFKSDLYAGLDEKKRIELGQFYTPAKICIKMIEKYSVEDFSDLDILDPTCGSGNLLIAMLIAGADSQRLYGNEYDEIAVDLCRKRINRACDLLGKPHIRDWQIHQGNALHEFALKYFAEDYEELYFDGKTQGAARKRRLENPQYNAFKDSDAYKRKYRTEAEEYGKQQDNNALSAQSEIFGTQSLFSF